MNIKQKKFSHDNRYRLNAICPYYTMFPLEFPMKLLGDLNRNAVVLDVFCGRGTTNYAARVKGLTSYGLDVSPVATAIAKAKLSSATADSVKILLDKILTDFKPKRLPTGDFWELCFHQETLKQICAVREGLLSLSESDTSVTLRALMLGCLHGPRNHNKKNASYFSNQMPRTFSAKPDYAVSYWKRNRLKPWKIDIRKVLLKKSKIAIASNYYAPVSPGNIFNEDSANIDFQKLFSDKVNIVITSPPYYGMRTYDQDQWLRNWFLGGPSKVDYSYSSSISHSSPEDFSKSLAKVWSNIYQVAADDLKMVIRFGALRSRNIDTEAILENSLTESCKEWKIYYRREVGTSNNGRRQAYLMGKASSSKPVDEKDYFVRLN